MRKYDLYGGLRDAELSIEKLNALARETASRAVRDGRSAFYKANARAAKARNIQRSDHKGPQRL